VLRPRQRGKCPETRQSGLSAGAAVTGTGDYSLGKDEQRQAKDTLRATQALIPGEVVPALHRVLEADSRPTW
jgi:hypothetical protein